MLLETAAPGQPARVVASGYDVFSDNAVYSVLACDPASDRAIVAVFGQGVAPSRLWVFRLSNGALMRSIDYRGSNPVRWVTASSDGAMLAESTRDAAGQLTTTVRAIDTGATLSTVDGLDAQGFSGDGSLLVGVTAAMTPALVEWKTGRLVWSMGAVAYGGSVAEPGGSRLAITLDDPGYTAVRSVVIVAPDGTAVYLPDRSRVR
jgi:hypothetical protein